uniref:inositol-phosphate phosphatase n=1 Tax=mine drainage metagenome TaxID=410659 RepID=E6QJY6_9ZZZZ
MSQILLPSETEVDLVWVSAAARIAHEAGHKLKAFFVDGVATEYKGDVDLVTVADRTVETFLRQELLREFPDHGIYGEEGTRDRLESGLRWYVDPLDGTTNFAHGFPHFCVSMGLEERRHGQSENEDGPIIAAVIYDPMRDEMFVAERGKGAWLNGRRMHVSSAPVLGEALIATGFPSRKRHASPNIHFYQEFTLRSHGVRRAGSAALDLAYVACGRMEAFWEFHLNPWDTSAGFLLVEEAGGRVTGFDGSVRKLNSLEVLASNGKIHEELLGLFAAMFAGQDLGPIPTPAEYAAGRRARQAAGAATI